MAHTWVNAPQKFWVEVGLCLPSPSPLGWLLILDACERVEEEGITGLR